MQERYDDYKLSKRELWAFLLIAYACAFMLMMLFYDSIIISAAVSLLVINLVPMFKKYKAEKRKKLLQRQFKDLLDSISASIAAGRKMDKALIEAEEHLLFIYDEESPICKEVKYINHEAEVNHRDIAELLEDFAVRSGIEDIISFAAVYSVSRRLGNDMEEVITKTNKTISEKINIMREIESITAQKRFEGHIISAMPILVIGGLNLFYPEYLEVLYTSLVGRLVMTFSLAGMVLAYIIMQKMMDIEV